MTEAKVHRERTKNFTEREKEIALDIINRYQNKIENKETDGVSQKERKDAWEKVAEEFNSASSTAPRTGKQMKVLWSNLRRTAKKNIAKENKKRYLDETNELGNIAELKRKKNEDKKNISKTGGGTFESQLTDVGARVLAMVEPQARPLPNLFDDDNIYHKDIVLLTQDQEISPPVLEPVEGHSNVNISDLPIYLEDECVPPSETVCEEIPTHQPPRKKYTPSKNKSNKKKAVDLKRTLYLKRIKLANMEIEFKKKMYELELKIKEKELEKISRND